MAGICARCGEYLKHEADCRGDNPVRAAAVVDLLLPHHASWYEFDELLVGTTDERAAVDAVLPRGRRERLWMALAELQAERQATAPTARPAARPWAGGDDLKAVPPPVYFRALAGVDAPESGGYVRCPLPGHEDSSPSCKVAADAAQGWYCHGCGRGGGIYQLQAALEGVDGPLRGADFLNVQARVQRAFA